MIALFNRVLCSAAVAGLIAWIVVGLLDEEIDGALIPSQHEGLAVWFPLLCLDMVIVLLLVGICSPYCSFRSSCAYLFMTSYVGLLTSSWYPVVHRDIMTEQSAEHIVAASCMPMHEVDHRCHVEQAYAENEE